MRDKALYPELDRPLVIELILVSQLLVLWPLFTHLPFWIRWVCLAVITLRFLMARFNKPVPSKWVTGFVGLIGVGGIYMHFGTFGGRDAGVSLITLMFCMKLLELKSYRDAALVLFLAFFIMVANFLFSQSLLMAGYMMLCMLVVLMTLESLNRPNGGVDVKHLAKRSGVMLLHAIPIMLIMFVTFPRLTEPLWRMPNSGSGTTGIDDSMTPGDIGSLATFDEVAFRVEFEGEVPEQSELYWRALVFSEFDGLTWSRSEQRVRFDPGIQYRGERRAYKISLEPTDRRWLYVLEMPESLDTQVRTSNELTFIRRFPVNSRLVYSGVSYTSSQYDLVLSENDRELNTRLPDDGNPRARIWAEQVFEQLGRDPERFIQAVLQTINQQNYVYTLSPGEMLQDTVDDFWFNKQQGYCEHYSSAFAFMMRSVGIPARIVTGYQGGEMNPYSNYMLVRQNKAHAWTEVWLEGRGWVRFDPTAAIHPSRVEVDLSQSWAQREQLFGDSVAGLLKDVDLGTIEKFKLYWDAINSAWQNMIVDYDAESQFNLFDNLGFNNMDFRDYLRLLVILTIGIMMLVAWWLLRLPEKIDPVAKSYRRFLKALAKLGYEKQPSEGPKDFVQRIIAERPDLKPKLLPILELYISLRSRTTGEDNPLRQQFIKRVSQLKLSESGT